MRFTQNLPEGFMPCVHFPGGVLTVAGTYQPGDQPPKSGYLEWHEWADVQRKAGIKMSQCSKCGAWLTPQEELRHAAKHSFCPEFTQEPT